MTAAIPPSRRALPGDLIFRCRLCSRPTFVGEVPGLTYAGRVKTPTLFINGEIDQRVPYSEAEQMYVALKKNGVPAKVIQYANMPHSISGSWNQVHRMINELHWLDKYLKAGKVS